MITICVYRSIKKKLTGCKDIKEWDLLEWGSELQLHLHTPEWASEHSQMNLQQDLNVTHCQWKVWLWAVLLRGATQVAGTQAQEFLKPGIWEKTAGLCFKVCFTGYRMISLPSLSRFPSHLLSCLFGAQTFCNSNYTMKDSPCASGIQFQLGPADIITIQIAPLVPWRQACYWPLSIRSGD